MKKFRVDTHFINSEGSFEPYNNLGQQNYLNLRDELAEQWQREGKGIIIEERTAAMIETPEDNLPSETRETATIPQRRGRPAKVSPPRLEHE